MSIISLIGYKTLQDPLFTLSTTPTQHLPTNHTPTTMPKKQSVKNQIRNIKRFLQKKGDTMDPSTKRDQERKLAILEAKVVDKLRQGKEQKLAVKYHRVKFFEKKKVLRKIKQLERTLKERRSSKESSTDTTLEECNLAAAKDNLTYIDYFPKDKKYVSLFVFDKQEDSKKRETLKKNLLASAQQRKAREEQEASTKANTTHLRDYDDDNTTSRSGASNNNEEDSFFLS